MAYTQTMLRSVTKMLDTLNSINTIADNADVFDLELSARITTARMAIAELALYLHNRQRPPVEDNEQ